MFIVIAAHANFQIFYFTWKRNINLCAAQKNLIARECLNITWMHFQKLDIHWNCHCHLVLVMTKKLTEEKHDTLEVNKILYILSHYSKNSEIVWLFHSMITKLTHCSSCCSNPTVFRSLKASWASSVTGETTSSTVWQTEIQMAREVDRHFVQFFTQWKEWKWQWKESNLFVWPHSAWHCSLPAFFV